MDQSTSTARDATGSPSNRKGTGSPSEPRVDVGLDRLSLSFPVSNLDERPERWDEERRRQTPDGPVRTFSKVERVGGVKVFVSVQEVPEAQASRWWGKVEGNPSRLCDPEGVGLVGVDGLAEAVGLLTLAVETALEPSEPVERWRVKRLDVARDFSEVEDPGRLIRGLAPVHRPHSRRNLVHADPARNRAETLMVGSGAGVVRLYNKHTESEGRAPEGTVRWEGECRKDWCKRYGEIGRLGDLRAESVAELAENRWEWSGMGVEVASTVGRLVQATAHSDLSERERVFFVGWLMCEAAGQPVRDLSKATLAKYRRVQREVGIAAPVDLTAQVQVVSRLDWESGRELLRVA